MSALKETIKAHPFFQHVAPKQLEMIAQGARAMQFRTGDLLFREGEPADRFFLIQSGAIALEAHEPGSGTVVLQKIEAGEVLGWSWLFPPFLWHFRARALEPTNVVILSGAHLLTAAETDHEFGYELMKRVSQVLVRRLQTTRKRILDEEIEASLEG